MFARATMGRRFARKFAGVGTTFAGGAAYYHVKQNEEGIGFAQHVPLWYSKGFTLANSYLGAWSDQIRWTEPEVSYLLHEAQHLASFAKFARESGMGSHALEKYLLERWAHAFGIHDAEDSKERTFPRAHVESSIVEMNKIIDEIRTSIDDGTPHSEYKNHDLLHLAYVTEKLLGFQGEIKNEYSFSVALVKRRAQEKHLQGVDSRLADLLITCTDKADRLAAVAHVAQRKRVRDLVSEAPSTMEKYHITTYKDQKKVEEILEKAWVEHRNVLHGARNVLLQNANPSPTNLPYSIRNQAFLFRHREGRFFPMLDWTLFLNSYVPWRRMTQAAAVGTVVVVFAGQDGAGFFAYKASDALLPLSAAIVDAGYSMLKVHHHIWQGTKYVVLEAIPKMPFAIKDATVASVKAVPAACGHVVGGVGSAWGATKSFVPKVGHGVRDYVWSPIYGGCAYVCTKIGSAGKAVTDKVSLSRTNSPTSDFIDGDMVVLGRPESSGATGSADDIKKTSDTIKINAQALGKVGIDGATDQKGVKA